MDAVHREVVAAYFEVLAREEHIVADPSQGASGEEHYEDRSDGDLGGPGEITELKAPRSNASMNVTLALPTEMNSVARSAGVP